MTVKIKHGLDLTDEESDRMWFPDITLKTINDEMSARGVFSYKSPFEDKFILITEVDDVYFNAEIKNGFG